MKKPNFCGIFATVFVAATVITLASCSQDDEYYEDGCLQEPRIPMLH